MDVESAAGIDARWSAVKAAGDDIVKVLEDFPGLAAAPLTVAAVQTIVDELNGREKCPSTGESGARTAQVMEAILGEFRGQARSTAAAR